MAEPFLGEIKMVSFNFPPKGWAMCNGQLLPINQNQALFSILGTTYGGDGRTTFALPNLQARVPMHFGNGHDLGQTGGEEGHTLTTAELPNHAHHQATGDQASSNTPKGNVLATKPRLGKNIYTAPANPVGLQPAASGPAGQTHSNLQPSLVLNFAIALAGIFPSRN